MKYGRGKVFDYNTSTGTSVIQFSSTFGNRWNRDNYGGGREVTVTRSDGNKETIVPVTNTTGISVTNPGNLDDEVLRYTAYIRGQKAHPLHLRYRSRYKDLMMRYLAGFIMGLHTSEALVE